MDRCLYLINKATYVSFFQINRNVENDKSIIIAVCIPTYNMFPCTLQKLLCYTRSDNVSVNILVFLRVCCIAFALPVQIIQNVPLCYQQNLFEKSKHKLSAYITKNRVHPITS